MHNLRRLTLGLVVLSALALCTLTSTAAQRTGPYILAVIPSAPPVTMHKLWAPFIDRLSRDTGLNLRLKVYEKMSDFERDISRGSPDFIFATSLQIVVAHNSQRYIPLVRSSKLVSAEIFVRTDSPIRVVDDLEGKRIAFVGNKNL